MNLVRLVQLERTLYGFSDRSLYRLGYRRVPGYSPMKLVNSAGVEPALRFRALIKSQLPSRSANCPLEDVAAEWIRR